MVVTPDNSTLIISESFAGKLTACRPDGLRSGSVSPLVQARGALEDCAVSVRMRDLLMGELETLRFEPTEKRIRGSSAR